MREANKIYKLVNPRVVFKKTLQKTFDSLEDALEEDMV